MATAIKPVFSGRQEKQLIDTLADINRALPLLDDAESCGIDCQALRGQLDQTRVKLENIRAKFMDTTGRRKRS